MNPKIIRVEAREPALLQVAFADGEVRLFDVSPYLDKGIFRELANADYFRQVRAAGRYVYWPNEQDLSADTLYLRGVPVDKQRGRLSA